MELTKFKIREIADINKSSISKKDHFSCISYLDTSSITENSVMGLCDIKLSEAPSRAQRKVEDKTIIYSTVRPRLKHYGILNNPPSNLIVSTGFATVDIKPDFKDRIDAEYLYLLLTQDYITEYIGNIADTSVSSYPSINPSEISSLSFLFPSIEEQKLVAKAIFSFNKKKANNKKQNLHLEAMAKQLYDYWFVQFDFPNEDGHPYKSSGGKMVWNVKLKRDIPDGWTVVKLKECTDVLLGGTPNTEDASLWNGDIPWLNSGEVAEFPILQSEKCITEKGKNSSATVLAPEGSVTLSITRHLRPSILGIDACINQSVVAIKETECLRREYLYPLIKNEIPRLMTLRTGAQQPHINKETVEDILLVIPSSNVMDKYIQHVKPMYNMILNNAKETITVTKLRDELLPLLMNGQVSIKGD